MYLEGAIKEVEKERSDLLVRATMAEQQFKTLQDHFKRMSQDYETKILGLKKRLAS